MSVFPYTGNKACIYPLIEDMTPDHDVYIEAFCGSAEVFFQKRPVKNCSHKIPVFPHLYHTLLQRYSICIFLLKCYNK